MVVSDVPPTSSMKGELELMTWLARPVATSQLEPKSLLACTIVTPRSAPSMNSSLMALWKTDDGLVCGTIEKDDDSTFGLFTVSQKAVW